MTPAERLSGYYSNMPREKRAWLLWSLPVFAVPYCIYYILFLNSFYHFGCGYFDGGLFAHVMWHNDWKISAPSFRADYSFLGVHFMPLLMLLNGLSWLVPLGMVEFFAAFMSASYGLLALALFYGLYRAWPRLLLLPVYAVLSVAMAFNGLIMNAIWMPHVEFIIPIFIFLFLMHYALGNRFLTLLFFVLTLSAREDGGFHLVAAMGLLAAADYWHTRSFAAIRRPAAYIGIATLYSIGACVANSLIHTTQSAYQASVFQDIYLGEPIYAHLNMALLWERLEIIALERLPLWLSMGLIAAVALRQRDLWLGIGLFAYAPWFMLNWFAHYGNTGTIYAYYIFPFVLMLCWPLVAAFWRYGGTLPDAVRKRTLLLQGVIALLMLVMIDLGSGRPQFGPVYGSLWTSYIPQETLGNRDRVNEFLALYAQADDIGRKAADPHAQSLLLGDLHDHQVEFHDMHVRMENLLFVGDPGRMPSPIILAHRELQQLRYYACLEGTSVCLLSQRPREALGKVGEMLSERTVPETWLSNDEAKALVEAELRRRVIW